jgi:hypothetical protein
MRWSDFHLGLGRSISYQPEFSHITGAVTAGLFVCNLVQWTGKQKDPDGWIYKTQDEIMQETGLTRREQETARKILKNKGFLEEERRGIPSRIYYRINLNALNDAVDDHLASYDGGKRHRVETESAIVSGTETPSFPLTELTAEETQARGQANIEAIKEKTEHLAQQHKRRQ